MDRLEDNKLERDDPDFLELKKNVRLQKLSPNFFSNIKGILVNSLTSFLPKIVRKPWYLTHMRCTSPFYYGGRYHTETSLLICSANQWSVFYMITAPVMKELR